MNLPVFVFVDTSYYIYKITFRKWINVDLSQILEFTEIIKKRPRN